VFVKQGNNSYAHQSRGVAPPKKFLSTSIRTLAEKRSSVAQDGQSSEDALYEGWLDNIANFEKLEHVTRNKIGWRKFMSYSCGTKTRRLSESHPNEMGSSAILKS
jgi:hypothetical protein